MTSLLIIFVLVGLAAGALLAAKAYDAWVAVNPDRWPAELTQAQNIRYVTKLLRRAGWAYAPPAEWMNVFVRGVKNQQWVSLMVHGHHSLSMDFLIRDAMEKSLGTGWNIGLVTRDRLYPEILAEADRGGVFIITPAQIADLDQIVAQLEARRAKAKADLKAEFAQPPKTVSTPLSSRI